MLIGNFRLRSSGIYSGEVVTLGLKLSGVTFIPSETHQGRGPDFVISADDSLEYDDAVVTFDIGAAWKRTDRNGKPYLSVKLDGPALPQPVQCALIINGESQSGHMLVWNRDTNTTKKAEQVITS